MNRLWRSGKQLSALLFFSAFLMRPANAQFRVLEGLEKYKSWPRYKAIQRFYQLNNQQLAWVGKPALQESLQQVLHLSSSLGLQEADYQGDFMKQHSLHEALLTSADSLDQDVHFTDAALHFFTEVKSGSKAPSFRYEGLRYNPGAEPPVAELVKHLNEGNLHELLVDLQPRSSEYAKALGRLKQLLQRVSEAGFTDSRITSRKVDSTNKSLLLRLYQFGITDTVNFSLSKKELTQKLKLAQAQFDLAQDGILGSLTRQAFNVPLQQRVEEVRILLNTLRWLEQIRQTSSVLVLNLAAANFFLYEHGQMLLYSKVIVGKKTTPTPTLTSTITEVILYPYWMVPNKIATKELLPKIRRNPGFLDEGNYQVLNRQGRVLNPYVINWSELGPGYFPYIIRQCTGCDNALGIVKFNFYNPFTVYLHDTPTKDLFSSDRRYYSHGCMRVEKPVELARYLLGFNRIAIDTLTEKGCLEHKSPKPVPVQKKLPVIVLYSTVWYNLEGDLRFYEDVYGRLPGSVKGKAAFRQQAAADVQ